MNTNIDNLSYEHRTLIRTTKAVLSILHECEDDNARNGYLGWLFRNLDQVLAAGIGDVLLAEMSDDQCKQFLKYFWSYPKEASVEFLHLE